MSRGPQVRVRVPKVFARARGRAGVAASLLSLGVLPATLGIATAAACSLIIVLPSGALGGSTTGGGGGSTTGGGGGSTTGGGTTIDSPQSPDPSATSHADSPHRPQSGGVTVIIVMPDGTVRRKVVSPDNPIVNDEPGSPDKPSPDKPSPDKPSPDKPSPDMPPPDMPSSDKPSPDMPSSSPPPTDPPTVPDTKSTKSADLPQ